MKNVFAVSTMDVQYVAMEKISGKLTIEELKQVQKRIRIDY